MLTTGFEHFDKGFWFKEIMFVSPSLPQIHSYSLLTGIIYSGMESSIATERYGVPIER
jgi:hypothetical protein